MPLRARFSKPISWSWIFAVPAAIVAALWSGIAQQIVADTAKEAHVSLSALWLWHSLLSGLKEWPIWLPWSLLVGLLANVISTNLADKKARPSRILAYHAMNLVWGRNIVLDDKADADDIVRVANQVRQQRGELLNLTTKVFTQAVADAFRVPHTLYLVDAQILCKGKTFYSERVGTLASVDQLLAIVESKWQAYRGWEYPTP